MGVASIVGLLQPAIDTGSTAAVAGGLAAGTAYASDTQGLGLFVILAIAVQNVGALIAYVLVEHVESLLFSFAFAAGAMLALAAAFGV